VCPRDAQEIRTAFFLNVRLCHVGVLAEEAEVGVHDEIGVEGVNTGKGEAVRLALSRAGVGAVDCAPLQRLVKNSLVDGEEIENAVAPPNIEFAVDVPVDFAVYRPAVEQKTRRGEIVVSLTCQIGRWNERQNLFDDRANAV